MDKKTEALNEFRELLYHLTKWKDGDGPAALKRKLICTPCGGHYGCVAAWVVAVEGSPPRGMIFIGQNEYTGMDDVFLIDAGKSRRLGDAQARIVRRFEDEWLSRGSHPVMDEVATVEIPAK